MLFQEYKSTFWLIDLVKNKYTLLCNDKSNINQPNPENFSSSNGPGGPELPPNPGDNQIIAGAGVAHQSQTYDSQSANEKFLAMKRNIEINRVETQNGNFPLPNRLDRDHPIESEYLKNYEAFKQATADPLEKSCIVPGSDVDKALKEAFDNDMYLKSCGAYIKNMPDLFKPKNGEQFVEYIRYLQQRKIFEGQSGLSSLPQSHYFSSKTIASKAMDGNSKEIFNNYLLSKAQTGDQYFQSKLDRHIKGSGFFIDKKFLDLMEKHFKDNNNN